MRALLYSQLGSETCRLCQSIEANNYAQQSQLFHAAVGSASGGAVLYIPGNPGEAHVAFARNDSRENETVTMVTLNHVMRGVDAALLKIDVEGFEWQVPFVIECYLDVVGPCW